MKARWLTGIVAGHHRDYRRRVHDVLGRVDFLRYHISSRYQIDREWHHLHVDDQYYIGCLYHFADVLYGDAYHHLSGGGSHDLPDDCHGGLHHHDLPGVVYDIYVRVDGGDITGDLDVDHLLHDGDDLPDDIMGDDRGFEDVATCSDDVYDYGHQGLHHDDLPDLVHDIHVVFNPGDLAGDDDVDRLVDYGDHLSHDDVCYAYSSHDDVCVTANDVLHDLPDDGHKLHSIGHLRYLFVQQFLLLVSDDILVFD